MLSRSVPSGAIKSAVSKNTRCLPAHTSVTVTFLRETKIISAQCCPFISLIAPEKKVMSSLSQEDEKLLRQLKRQPNLKKRIQSILSIAEDDGEGIVKADEAEGRIIEEVRQIGNETLTEWAVSRIEKSETYLPPDENITRSGQKKHIGTRRSV
jgi:hypothetical protein